MGIERRREMTRRGAAPAQVLNQQPSFFSPDYLVNQLMMPEEETSVKIIELNSSTSSKESSSPTNANINHAWSYANSSKSKEKENYKVNEEARRRRRRNILDRNEAYAAVYENQYFYDQAVQSDYSSYYERLDAEYSAPINHQMNCFTIINNNDSLKSDSSTDNEHRDGVEVIEIDNSDEPSLWNHVYNDEVIPYDPSKQQETRTIWIYSYKNKRLLTENDYELVNIPTQDMSDTSTSCSLTDEDTKVDKCITASRLGSPIPATYIPRLDLSVVQTLSTVTEVTEPNKCYSKESSQEAININIKPKNNWLTERNENIEMENSNVVNWLALSPRERRRRSFNTELEESDLENLREKEITYAEGGTKFQVANEDSLSDDKVESSTAHVQVDLHSDKASQAVLSLAVLSHRSAVIETNLCNKISNVIPIDISYADLAEIEVNNIKLDESNKPSIEISTKVNKTEITGPIEKLDSDNWITEDKIEKETVVYDYDLENSDDMNASVSNSETVPEDSANTRLWLKNLRLMKPPEWAEYLPITCSPPSLHLSISLGSLTDKKSWFKRLTKFIKCCK